MSVSSRISSCQVANDTVSMVSENHQLTRKCDTKPNGLRITRQRAFAVDNQEGARSHSRAENRPARAGRVHARVRHDGGGGRPRARAPTVPAALPDANGTGGHRPTLPYLPASRSACGAAADPHGRAPAGRAWFHAAGSGAAYSYGDMLGRDHALVGSPHSCPTFRSRRRCLSCPHPHLPTFSAARA